MEWDKKTISALELSVSERHRKMSAERRTDRKNMSEIWNRHVSEIGISLVRQRGDRMLSVQDIVDVINNRNPEVSDALCIANPDRRGQYLLVPRDMAEKILALGMP